MKATLLTTAIFSLFLTSCASSMITANNNSSVNDFETELPAKGTANIEKKQLPLTQVPTMVLAAVKKSYPTQTIKTMSRFTSDGVVYYEFELQNKRKKPVTVVFNANAKEELAKR